MEVGLRRQTYSFCELLSLTTNSNINEEGSEGKKTKKKRKKERKEMNKDMYEMRNKSN